LPFGSLSKVKRELGLKELSPRKEATRRSRNRVRHAVCLRTEIFGADLYGKNRNTGSHFWSEVDKGLA